MSSLHDEAATAVSDSSISNNNTTQIIESNNSGGSNDSETIAAAASDPFAHDLFAKPSAAAVSVATALASEDAAADETAVKTTVAAWQTALPRVSFDVQQLSSALSEIPFNLADAITTTLLAALKENLHAANVSLKILDARELSSLNGSFNKEPSLENSETDALPEGGLQTQANLQCLLAIEPANQIFTLDFNKGFAVSLVDRMLGGSGTLTVSRDEISVTEIAVFVSFFDFD